MAGRLAAKRTQYASPFARRRSLEYTWMFTHAYMQHMLLLTAAVAPQCASSHILASLAAQQAGGQSVRCKYSGTATGPVMLSANNHHTIVSPHGVGMHFLPIRNYRFSWCLPPAAANSCSAMVSMLAMLHVCMCIPYSLNMEYLRAIGAVPLSHAETSS